MVFLAAAAVLTTPFLAPGQPALPDVPSAPRLRPQTTSAAADYSSNIVVIREAQEEALEQARQMLKQDENPRRLAALQAAVQEMEHSKAMLEQAQTTPTKLPAALTAQQAAYQALLKMLPREFRVSRSRNGGQNFGAGQPTPRELDQLEMTGEENRYETERQATVAPDAQQRARVQTADRLKQLAQRQQDLNERLRELQTALQEARTEQQREEVRRELKRLQNEERRMLAELDELRQRVAKSSDAGALAETRQRLDQTRSDVQRAAEDLDQESASQALAAGTRAQESMQQLREDLRRKTSTQFSEQMRQLRSQARELTDREDQLARQLDSLANAEHKTLDDSSQQQVLIRQIAAQQRALTNLLSGLRTVTEQAESTEPLLAQQLYDALRRAAQTHPDNLLETTAQLVDRGFLPQAGEAERSARQTMYQLRQNVERAAESVLGNEAEALRYAQRELEDLKRQVEGDVALAQTNPPAPPQAGDSLGTNTPSADRAARSPDRSRRLQADRQAGPARGERNSEPDAADAGGRRSDSRPETAGNNPSREPTDGSRVGAAPAAAGGERADRDRLRQFAEQLGGATGGEASAGGPITGNNFVDWSDRMRDVEHVLDSADLRSQLATVRERVGAFRGYYRRSGGVPQAEVVRNQVLVPMTQVRFWLQEEIARLDNANSLVPLDRDPVPDHFSELVRRYYERLGSAQPETSGKENHLRP